VLVLSHHVETRQAIRLLQDTPQRVGYLLKDRVSEISEFTDAIQRIAHGGSVMDPEVVAHLLRRCADGALAGLTSREHEILALMAQGPIKPRYWRAAVPLTENSRDPYRVHLRQARPAARRR